jgi:hypothetical protein
MGNTHSNDLQLSDLPQEDYQLFLDEEYTVIRTNGMIQPGWKIRKGTHYCPNSDPRSADHRRESVIAIYDNDILTGYKFFMVFDPCDEACRKACHSVDPCGHLCGWRACYPEKRTFWPTRLTTDAEKETWWTWVDGRLDHLQQKRQDAEAEAAKE